MSVSVQINQHDRVLELRMQRPEKKNALTGEMYARMAEALRKADDDASVRAVVIAGSDDCFTAGNDLGDFLNKPPTGSDAPVWAFLDAISQGKKPLISAVEGLAVGIGTTLLLHCDLNYAGRSARFQLPFVRLGLCPEAASSLLLPNISGYPLAAEALLLGHMFGAEKAVQMNILNAVLDDGQARSKALEVAAELAALPPDAVMTSRRLLRQATGRGVAQVMQTEADEFVRLLQGPEAKEAVSAFLEKRQADFSRF